MIHVTIKRKKNITTAAMNPPKKLPVSYSPFIEVAALSKLVVTGSGASTGYWALARQAKDDKARDKAMFFIFLFNICYLIVNINISTYSSQSSGVLGFW